MNRLAKQLEGQAEFIRVNVATPTGLAIAQIYDVRATPTLFVFDGTGNVVYSHVGIPNAGQVVAVVGDLNGD